MIRMLMTNKSTGQEHIVWLTETEFDLKRKTKATAERFLKTWVEAHGELNILYTLIDVLTEPMELEERVIRVVKLADGTEVGPLVGEDGKTVLAEHDGKVTRHNKRFVKLERKAPETNPATDLHGSRNDGN